MDFHETWSELQNNFYFFRFLECVYQHGGCVNFWGGSTVGVWHTEVLCGNVSMTNRTISAQVEAQYTYTQYAQCVFSFESDHKLHTVAAGYTKWIGNILCLWQCATLRLQTKKVRGVCIVKTKHATGIKNCIIISLYFLLASLYRLKYMKTNWHHNFFSEMSVDIHIRS